MKELSEKTKREMEAGRATVRRARAWEVAGAMEAKLRRNMPKPFSALVMPAYDHDRKTWMMNVKLSKAGEIFLETAETVEEFPSPTLKTQIMLVSGDGVK